MNCSIDRGFNEAVFWSSADECADNCLNQADVFVLPSIEEGLCLVMAEAMAYGCPVIATTNTGASDIFTDRKEGFIVPIRSSEEIAEKLQFLADNPEKQPQMPEASLEKAHHLGAWDAYGDSMMKLFNKIVK